MKLAELNISVNLHHSMVSSDRCSVLRLLNSKELVRAHEPAQIIHKRSYFNRLGIYVDRESTGSQLDFFRMLDAKVEQGGAFAQHRQQSRLSKRTVSII